MAELRNSIAFDRCEKKSKQSTGGEQRGFHVRGMRGGIIGKKKQKKLSMQVANYLGFRNRVGNHVVVFLSAGGGTRKCQVILKLE